MALFFHCTIENKDKPNQEPAELGVRGHALLISETFKKRLLRHYGAVFNCQRGEKRVHFFSFAMNLSPMIVDIM